MARVRRQPPDPLSAALAGEALPLEVASRGPVLASPLRVEELLVGSCAAALLAAAELAEARTGRAPEVALDVDGVAVAAASERHVRWDGRPVGVAWDPLSRFLPAADGWVRLHGNYDWHRAALHRALGDDVPATVARMPAAEVEEAVVAAGGCAAAVRDAEDWAASAPGRAVGPVVGWSDGPAAGRPLPATAALPAAGVRVVDLTRVIAGPVGTRMLAALGARVVRIDDPHHPELALAALDGGIGKAWRALDLREPAGRAALEALLAQADVVVAGLRPGALDAFGLHPDALAERHPHLVHVSLSAWGTDGPWGTRRGFDSLVQAATGIAVTVGDGDRPGALPVQALDHATGYLLAAAVLQALTRRHLEGRAARAALALAATARVLLDAGTRIPAPSREPDPAPHLVERGRLRVAAPPGSLDGRPLQWP